MAWTVFLLRHPPAVATRLAVSATLAACTAKLRHFSVKLGSRPGVPMKKKTNQYMNEQIKE